MRLTRLCISLAQLFFGNAQSLRNYVASLFEDDILLADLAIIEATPPKPRYRILDFALVTGMDASSLDQMKEILAICRLNMCNLFVSGLPRALRADWDFAEIQERDSSSRRFAFFPDLESTIGWAEDGLLSNVFHLEDKSRQEAQLRQRVRRNSMMDEGFAYALRKIDETVSAFVRAMYFRFDGDRITAFG